MNLTRACLLSVALLLTLSCTASYSVWTTLGYQSKQRDGNQDLIEGMYNPPILEVSNGLFFWIKPDSMHELGNKSAECDGQYKGFIFYIWSSDETINWDIAESSVEWGGGKYGFKTDVLLNENKKMVESRALSDLKITNDDELRKLNELAGKGSFYPNSFYLDNGNRVELDLSNPVTCNNKNVTLKLKVNQKNISVELFTIIFRKLHR